MTELEYLLGKLVFDMDLVEKAIVNSGKEYVDLCEMLTKLKCMIGEL